MITSCIWSDNKTIVTIYSLNIYYIVDIFFIPKLYTMHLPQHQEVCKIANTSYVDCIVKDFLENYSMSKWLKIRKHLDSKWLYWFHSFYGSNLNYKAIKRTDSILSILFLLHFWLKIEPNLRSRQIDRWTLHR